jgi:hypothetical protein
MANEIDRRTDIQPTRPNRPAPGSAGVPPAWRSSLGEPPADDCGLWTVDCGLWTVDWRLLTLVLGASLELGAWMFSPPVSAFRFPLSAFNFPLCLIMPFPLLTDGSVYLPSSQKIQPFSSIRG